MPIKPDRPDDPLARARRLRRDMTQPERALWRELRDLRRLGLKFRRQVPFGPYVVDFYEPARQLAIELDGESHLGRFEYDDARQQWLESQGLHILRLANDDVVKDIGAVVEAILAYRERMP